MVCPCGNDKAYKIIEIVNGPTYCDRCGYTGTFNLPDVYVDGKPEENLPDDPRTGKPPVFTSRSDKALFLKTHKLIECRGREHGGPAIPATEPAYNKEAAREEARAAISHVQKMGKDYRRQEYLRIVKERRHSR